ncbi:DUF3853 family protein [Sphingobacterium chungjuense]|uniref:DUF3853 family protein n=1 Tax=Sphingobacterium chungjuense TaxID=2675553 RepID=UPI00140DAA56|nr:DUF3853 family protein [Sphingobacterium chungjuense]
MDIHSLLKKPVAMMTGEELVALQTEAISKTPQEEKEKNLPDFVFGLQGIQQLFNCSKSKAQKLKKEVIGNAIDQDQRTIIVDTKKALELFKEFSRNKKRRFL